MRQMDQLARMTLRIESNSLLASIHAEEFGGGE